MKILSYIPILILLALGCASRTGKIKGESETRQSQVQLQENELNYQYLIDMYNDGQYDKFYEDLDELKVSANCHKIKNVDSVPGYFAVPDMIFEVHDDSALITVFILSPNMQLLKLFMNRTVFAGAYACYFDDLFYFKEGTYYLMKKIGSNKQFKKIVLLK